MGQHRLRPGGAESGQTAAQKRYPLRHIAILDLDPPAIDRAPRTLEGKTILGRHRNELVCPLIQDCVVSDQAKQSGVGSQGPSERRRMSQSPRLSDGRIAPCQCLVGEAETE
jgi:hypothetical protein